MVFKLDHCCFCADLRLGSLIIGYSHLMKDIIQILVSTIILAVFVANRSGYHYEYYDIPIGISATFLAFGLISLTFTILLLSGLNQYKPAFVLAFLIYSGVSTVIYSIIGLVLICMSELFVLFIPGLLFLAMYIYFLLVIRSYYPKIDDAEMKAAIFRTPAGPFAAPSNYVHSQI